MLCSHSLYLENVNYVIMVLKGEKELITITPKF